MLHERARAKVNLYLHLTGRRGDGYHLLDSLAVFPDVADRLAAAPAEGLGLSIEGPFAAGLGAGPDNLVLRAARALQAALGPDAGRDAGPGAGPDADLGAGAGAGVGAARGARLVLDKRLPVASGIGGGSADAAAALRLLTRLWGVGLAAHRLAALAQGLGADVPVCLAQRPARMGGVGEVLRPAPRLPECGLLLVNPGVVLATGAVFAAFAGPMRPPARLPEGWADAAALAAGLADLANDLEAPARALCPAVGTALGWLAARPGCLLARMSGSGATCFGLFPTPAAARAAAAQAPAGWWSWGGGLD